MRAIPAIALFAIAGLLIREWIASLTNLLAATLAANLIGCLIIGMIAALADRPRPLLPEHLRVGLATGFCGGLTTFSMLSWLVAGPDAPPPHLAAAYLALSLGGGITAAALGQALCRPQKKT